MTLNEFAKKWNRPSDSNFSVACYDMHSIGEMEDALECYDEREFDDDADHMIRIDCDAWGITEEEWLDGIRAALKALRDEVGTNR